jgi:hypothetical protein
VALEIVHVIFADVHNEHSIVEVAIGLLIELTLRHATTGAIEVFKAQHQVFATVGVSHHMLQTISVLGVRCPEDIGICTTVEAIGAQPEVQLGVSGNVAQLHGIAQLQGIGTFTNTTCHSAGNIAEEHARLVATTCGGVAQLVAVASAFVDEGHFYIVAILEEQLVGVNLELAAVRHIQAFLIHELLEGGVIKANCRLTENWRLGPGIVPGKCCGGTRLGKNACHSGDSNKQTREKLLIHGENLTERGIWNRWVCVSNTAFYVRFVCSSIFVTGVSYPRHRIDKEFAEALINGLFPSVIAGFARLNIDSAKGLIYVVHADYLLLYENGRSPLSQV